MTASSYASTAKPPPVLEKNLGLSLGGDFAEMFSGFDKRRSTILDAEENRAMSQSPVSTYVFKSLNSLGTKTNSKAGNLVPWAC